MNPEDKLRQLVSSGQYEISKKVMQSLLAVKMSPLYNNDVEKALQVIQGNLLSCNIEWGWLSKEQLDDQLRELVDDANKFMSTYFPTSN